MAGEFRMSDGPAGVDTGHGHLAITVDTLGVFALLQIIDHCAELPVSSLSFI